MGFGKKLEFIFVVVIDFSQIKILRFLFEWGR